MESAAATSEASPLVTDPSAAPATQAEDTLVVVNAALKPVAATMILTSVLVVLASPEDEPVLLYPEDDDRLTGARLRKGLLNSLAIVGAVLAVTVCVVLLYWLDCETCLGGYMMASSFLLLFTLGGALAAEFVSPSILSVVGLYNFSALGVASIFAPERFGLSATATRTYLVIVAVVVAWHLSSYPPVTKWIGLVALALYDVLAVLTPCGPLNLLVSLMQHRQKPLPSLLYEVDVAVEHDEEDQDDKDPGGSSPRNIKVGLGDFIFFSVLVSEAARHSLLAAFFATTACLVGLAATLAILAVYQRPVPALPISIALGVAATFATDLLLLPMVQAFADHAILI